MSGVPSFDSSAVVVMLEVVKFLQARDIKVHTNKHTHTHTNKDTHTHTHTHTHTQVVLVRNGEDHLRKLVLLSGLDLIVGRENIYLSADDALAHLDLPGVGMLCVTACYLLHTPRRPRSLF
jgi:hypothetical protein